MPDCDTNAPLIIGETHWIAIYVPLVLKDQK